MKKSYKILLFTALASMGLGLTGYACDICGCANSGSYYGIMPQSHKSMVGIRYNYMHFHTHPENTILATKETFHVAEIYGRFFPIRRVQVMAFVPYRFDEQVTSAITKKNSGLGDVTVLANYNLFNSLMDGTGSPDRVHSVMIGGGVKAPTGKFRYDENDPLQVANANFQLGTGSIDFILNAFYSLQWNKWGLSSNISRKFNTTNSEDYRFGNQLFGSVDFFRTFKLGNLSFMPSLGIYAEHAEHGKQRGQILDITGGTLINGAAGLNFFGEKWTFGVVAQTPLHQKSASGHVFLKDRAIAQLAFLF